MIKNYFKIAFRSFWKHKIFTLINIIGLSIGITASVAIYLIVHYDFTFDKFHRDSDRIYRVVSDFSFQGQQGHNCGVCAPVANAARTKTTGVELSTPVFCLSPDVSVTRPGDKLPTKFKAADRIVLVDPQYFKIFDYTWLAGSSVHALDAPNQVVLTSERAKLYFPNLSYDQMIGKIITYDTLKTTVSGIVQTITQNTDLSFHDFISYSTACANKGVADQMQLDQWDSTNSAFLVFIKLFPNTSAANVQGQLNAILKKNHPPTPDDKGSTHGFTLQPLSNMHFDANYGISDYSSTASKTTLYGLLVIAAFLLVLACINFVNLTTAQATQRAKEIGIRKTMGSSRQQLITQFLSETFLITLIAVIISIALTPLVLKLFSDFIASGITADFIHQPGILVFLLILTVVVTLLSGFYPAIILSGYKPVEVLKNQAQSNSSKTRNAWLRKSLTVSQFVIAQFFIMATVLVGKQVYYALHKDLGFKKDAIIVLQSPWRDRKQSSNRVLLNEFRAIPQVAMVSSGNGAPSSDQMNGTLGLYMDGKKEIKTQVEIKSGDENYIKVYQIKLLAGRNIQASDTGKAIIINDNYAKLLGFKNPDDAIGKQLEKLDGDKNITIVGVVADFYERGLQSPITPLIMQYARGAYQTSTFHIALKPESAGGNEWKTAIAAIGKDWKQVYPDDDFNYNFYDDTIKQFYQSEQHTSTLLTWATGLSILISCLGLLGLAIYTTTQRTKEIGVRKVLGATVAQIVTLLSTELVMLILLSLAIVTPVAWWAMNKWLESYADKTTISWWIFAASGAGMLLAAIFTSSFQTVRAAIANPVKSLRSE